MARSMRQPGPVVSVLKKPNYLLTGNTYKVEIAKGNTYQGKLPNGRTSEEIVSEIQVAFNGLKTNAEKEAALTELIGTKRQNSLHFVLSKTFFAIPAELVDYPAVRKPSPAKAALSIADHILTQKDQTYKIVLALFAPFQHQPDQKEENLKRDESVANA